MVTHAVRLILPTLLLGLLVAGCRSMLPVASESGAAGPAVSLAVDATDGSLIKAGGGIFRSTDQGRSWTPLAVPAAMQPARIRQVATSSAAPSSLYAAGAGIVRSDDGGQAWRSLSAGLPGQDVAAIAVHSFRPDTLYAWLKGEGVFRTEDDGGRWQKMDAGPPADVLTLTHSALEGSMNTGWLYAATPDGPYLSMDCF